MPEPLPVRPARPDEVAAASSGADAGIRINVFELAGGEAFFDALVDRFYQGVESDPELLALYPDRDDLAGARRRLAMFLAQYWGGPTTYSEERGHPRLFMRHRPFRIDAAGVERWLTHMRAAVAELAPPAPVESRLLAYFDMAAAAMRNTA